MTDRKRKLPSQRPKRHTHSGIQLVIAGVGGQGVLFATRVLAELGMGRGLPVMTSETHGMSQRGGSVASHLKLGRFQSPLVRKGEADALFVFQEHELYRSAAFLRPGGHCFINVGDPFRPASALKTHFSEAGIGLHRLDADRMAVSLGSLVLANLIMLGYSLAHPDLPLTIASLEQAIRRLSKPAFTEMNLLAAREGYAAGRKAFSR